MRRRKYEILEELLTGKSNAEIAYDLGISEKTVKYHVCVIIKIFNVRNRYEAAKYYRAFRERYLKEYKRIKA